MDIEVRGMVVYTTAGSHFNLCLQAHTWLLISPTTLGKPTTTLNPVLALTS